MFDKFHLSGSNFSFIMDGLLYKICLSFVKDY